MAIFNLKPENITNLELKLEGKLPINRDELLALVNSWGRISSFCTLDKNSYEIEIIPCNANERYDLSNLDVSQIKNFEDVFRYSNFNGDINSWDVFNATSMISMFYYAKYFNSPLYKWNTSKVKSMAFMFCESEKFNYPLDNWDVSNVSNMVYMFDHAIKFNQNINSWNISKVTSINSMFQSAKAFNQAILWDLSNIKSCRNMFLNANAFENRFNNRKELLNGTNEIKEWLIENKSLMEAINIEDNKSKELEEFLSNLNVITSMKLNGLHGNKNIKEIYNGNI